MTKLWAGLIIGTLAFGTAFLDFVPSHAAAAFTARSSDAGGVKVVVTPKVLGPAVKVWEFEVVMDTHIKPLNEDLAQVAVLVDDSGRIYKPAAWKGDPPGGHHRKGVLQFSAPADMPAAVELQLETIGGPGTRKFRWELR